MKRSLNIASKTAKRQKTTTTAALNPAAISIPENVSNTSLEPVPASTPAPASSTPTPSTSTHPTSTASMLENKTKRTRRIVVLFDLNGTLTSLTKVRRNLNVTNVRPGCHHLLKLDRKKFDLQIFSSASKPNVYKMANQLKENCGVRFSKIYHRDYCEKAPFQAGGKAWDTVKPLGKYFCNLRGGPGLENVILVDDSAEKVLGEEKKNLIHIPVWDERKDDVMIQHLVERLLHYHEHADVRTFTRDITTTLQQKRISLDLGSKAPPPPPTESAEKLAAATASILASALSGFSSSKNTPAPSHSSASLKRRK